MGRGLDRIPLRSGSRKAGKIPTGPWAIRTRGPTADEKAQVGGYGLLVKPAILKEERT